jgi:putative addiction module component (TIGR02574 family)
MVPTLQDLGIDRLDAEHRLQLIGEIWDSLSMETTLIPESHRQELDCRLDAADSGLVDSRPRDEVRARLRDGKCPIGFSSAPRRSRMSLKIAIRSRTKS